MYVHIPLFLIALSRPQVGSTLEIVKAFTIIYGLLVPVLALLSYITASVPTTRRIIDEYLGAGFVGYCHINMVPRTAARAILAGSVLIGGAHASDVIQDQTNIQAIQSLEQATGRPTPPELVSDIINRQSPVRTSLTLARESVKVAGATTEPMKQVSSAITSGIHDGVKEGVKEGVSTTISKGVDALMGKKDC